MDVKKRYLGLVPDSGPGLLWSSAHRRAGSYSQMCNKWELRRSLFPLAWQQTPTTPAEGTSQATLSQTCFVYEVRMKLAVRI